MSAAELVGVLAELDRLRSVVVALLERDAPQLLPVPPEDLPAAERAAYELLVGLRRAVLGHPAAARSLHDLLVAQGRRYARTPEGAALRDGLVAAEGVEHLRRIWETVSLNVVDGPASPSGVPDAWADLLADVIAGHALRGGPTEAVLARLRPEGFA